MNQRRKEPIPGAEDVTVSEGSSAVAGIKGRGGNAPGGVDARGAHGRDDPVNWESLIAPQIEVGPRQGEPELKPMVVRQSEGCIRAQTLGNSGQLDPVEQRRPVLIRTFGGKHDKSKDF